MNTHNCITTVTGIQFDVANPTADMVCIGDIAHALAHLTRWGGQCKTFFSIAQHSVLVSLYCPPELALWGLLHDAAEAYYGDVSRPLKRLLPEYKALEKAAMQVIAAKYGLPWPEPPELKTWDNMVFCMEAKALMPPLSQAGDVPDVFDILPVLPDPLHPVAARSLFLRRFCVLTEPCFLGVPERWMDDPTWLCKNGHMSKHYIKSEGLGYDACPVCMERVALTDPREYQSNA